MNSKDYWEQREAEALRRYQRDEKEYSKQLDQIYQNMLDEIEQEITSFYGKYAAKENITIAEAKRRVSKLDIEAYERKAAKYVKDKDFSKQANEEMRLYNLTMKVNRLEMLKANIGLHLITAVDEQEKFMAKILQGRTEEELARQAGILGKTVRDNAKLAQTIPNASFHNATFSERVWSNQTAMKAELSKLLQSGLIRGENPRALARDLRKVVNASTSNAERLMRTELARVQTEAQKQSFLQNGFTEYTFHANSRCCDVCSALDGKHFKVKDMMPGLNAPPMHPNCRCSTSAYEDSGEYEAWLDFLSKGGTTEEWNRRKTVAKQTKSSIIKLDFSSEELRKKHYEKHQAEFEGLSEDGYIAQANKLANAPLSDDVERLTRSDDSVSTYRFSTNEFLVITKEGCIRTYFKPSKGADYWREEHERNEKK
ncbi:MAG: minor capsid protein [Butyricicoccus sp.]